MATLVVQELHGTFAFYLAGIQRLAGSQLDPRIVAALIEELQGG